MCQQDSFKVFQDRNGNSLGHSDILYVFEINWHLMIGFSAANLDFLPTFHGSLRRFFFHGSFDSSVIRKELYSVFQIALGISNTSLGSYLLLFFNDSVKVQQKNRQRSLMHFQRINNDIKEREEESSKHVTWCFLQADMIQIPPSYDPTSISNGF